MKICSVCKVPKNISEFNKSKDKKDGLHTTCKLCSRERSKKHYKEHKSKYIERAKVFSTKAKDEFKPIYNELKSKGCFFCDEKELCCLDFHHLDKNNKDTEVARLVVTKRFKKALEEIKKCILVCSNCHRKIHAGILNIAGGPVPG